MSSTKLVVGITGGIGSGKSTVASLFANHGVAIIDTDQISRDLTVKGSPALQAIALQFGETLLQNGELNRKALRQLVFADPEKRIWLEELLHPMIRDEMRNQVAAVTAPYCMVIIPLLFENPANPLIKRILVVDTDEELQIARVAQRDFHSTLEVEAIMETQVSRQVRLDGADDIIFNTAGPEFLVPQVEKLHLAYLTLAGTESL